MGWTIGVVGASGGLGASTLTAAVAMRALSRLDPGERALVVDLDVRGGIDTTLCLEHLAGCRWGDLPSGEYSLDGLDEVPLLEDLPHDDGIVVLTGGADGRSRPRDEALVLDTLAPSVAVVVVDCGSRPSGRVLSRLDVLVVLAATTPRGARDADALVRACALGGARPVLVTRGPRRRCGRALAERLGMPLLTHLPQDSAVAEQALRGSPPGARPSAIEPVADAVLDLAQIRWLDALVTRLDRDVQQSRQGTSWTV